MMRTFPVLTLLALLSTWAAACPLCIGTAARSSSQDLGELSRALLAAPQGRGYRVVAVIKGGEPVPELEEVVVREPVQAGKAVLLVRDEAWPMWVSVGSVNARHAPTLRALAQPQPPENDSAAWRRRLEVALPHLQGPEPLLSEIAYAECASAPYAALRSARARIDVRTLRRWLDDPKLASRQSLYILLAGIAGDARDADAIEARLETALRVHDASDVASLLAADLELRGPARMAWVEDRYLRDPTRTGAELQAALLALRVQANSGGAITRDRVIAAYRLLIRERKDVAGLVAPDLAAWQYWDAAPELAALMKDGGRQQFAARDAIGAYLQQSPLRAEAP